MPSTLRGYELFAGTRVDVSVCVSECVFGSVNEGGGVGAVGGCVSVDGACVGAGRSAAGAVSARTIGHDCGLKSKRPTLARVLSDPSASVVFVEHGDGLAPIGVEHLTAAGHWIVVVDEGETADDLVREMIEVLTSRCARLYGRRGARNRALRAVTATKQAEPAAKAR
jgi:hypothetical protein